MSLRSFLGRHRPLLCDEEGKADSKLPTLLLILVVTVGGYVGWQYFVPYWNTRVLSDFIRDQAVFDPFEKIKPTEDSIKAAVFNKLRELGIRFEEGRDGQKLEVLPKTELAFEVHLRYKQTIRVYGMKPKTWTYQIDFDGTEMAKAIIPDRPVQ
jgi:hypothetical protein